MIPKRILILLDSWWENREHRNRVDRDPMYICVMVGLIVVAFGLMFGAGTGLDPVLEDWLSLMIFVGAAIVFLGMSSGRPGLFLKNLDRRRSYMLAVIGTPAVVFGLWVFSGSVVISALIWPSKLSGALGLFLGLGALLEAVGLLLEIRRIDRTIPVVEAVESDDPLAPLPEPQIPLNGESS